MLFFEVNMKNLGLYIHIPFCSQKCRYCDFVTRKNKLEQHYEYIDLLQKEISMYSSDLCFNTIYIGGGTPSLLNADAFYELITSIKRRFHWNVEEFTMECNLEELDDEKLRIYQQVGVNRISLGVQSFEPKALRYMGRRHTVADVYHAVEKIRQYGILNISFDLIFGFENQTDFKADFQHIKKLNPQHISWYNLIIENGTPLHRLYEQGLISENEERDQNSYLWITQRLQEIGYFQYEISNYAKSGFQSIHNLKYWRNKEYIGIGLAASGYYHGYRTTNESSYKIYREAILNQQFAWKEKEFIDEMLLQYEYVIMHMRLKEGIQRDDFIKKFQYDFIQWNHTIIQQYMQSKLIELSDGRLYFTTKGFFISNHFFREIRFKDLTK